MVRHSVVIKVVVETEILTLSRSLKINLTCASAGQLCDKPQSRTSPTREVPVSRIRSYNSGESRVSWLSNLWRKLISFLSQDLCNPQDSGEVRILMAGKQECTTKRSLLTHCFPLDCPLSNILRVSKPTRSQRRNPARLLGHVVFRSVAVAWKPSLWWNESCWLRNGRRRCL